MATVYVALLLLVFWPLFDFSHRPAGRFPATAKETWRTWLLVGALTGTLLFFTAAYIVTVILPSRRRSPGRNGSGGGVASAKG